jgi:hypothetical protein
MTMKKIVICVMMMLPFIGFSQKKENGKIYIEHPAIKVVDAFTKAMVSGDTTAMSAMMTYSPVDATPFSKGNKKSDFLGTAIWMHENLDYYSIKPMGGSYPDAFEYAKDPSDNNAVTVESWDVRKGVHKKTGVKVDQYLHRSFTLTKDNKIRRVMTYNNPEIGNKIRSGYSESKNGVIYNEHAAINSLRLMIGAGENGDFEKYYSFFDKDATFSDINTEDFKSTSLDDVKARDKALLEKFELVGVEQVGYPDYMHYDMGNSGVLYSWWNFHFVRKSDKKEIKVPVHYQHNVNDEGKFVNRISYYNGSLLK